MVWLVRDNGTSMINGVDFTISGKIITFTVAPSNGTHVYITYIKLNALGQVGVGEVNTASNFGPQGV